MQTVSGCALAFPPTLPGPSVTIASAEKAGTQLPLCTTARNFEGALNGPVENGLAPALDGTLNQLRPPSIDVSQRTTIPTAPVAVKVTPLPVHTVSGCALAVPPTLTAPNITAASLEKALAQLPFCTTARNRVDTFSGPVENWPAPALDGALNQLSPPSVDDSHRITVPTAFANVNVVPFPLHTVSGCALTVPPTLPGAIDTVASAEVVAGQLPLCTTARNFVGTLSGPASGYTGDGPLLPHRITRPAR
jgi:hypothetical protein